MQITHPRGNFIEKILRDSSGKLFRATFCVYECEGHIKARLLHADYIVEKNPQQQNKVDFLDGLKKKEVYSSIPSFTNKIVSPFIYSNILNYSGSKPRAPTF